MPLPEVAHAVGLPRGTRDVLVRDGAIKPCGGGGRGKPYLISWDDVVLVVTAVVLAAAAGITITVAIRALRNTGARVINGAITIPVGAR